MTSDDDVITILIIDPASHEGPYDLSGVVHSVVEVHPSYTYASIAQLVKESLRDEQQFILNNEYALKQLDHLLRYTSFDGNTPAPGESVELSRIPHVVLDDGSVQFRLFIEGMPVTREGLVNASRAGLAPPFNGVLAVAPHRAHGGWDGFVDLPGWLLDHAVDLGIGSLLTVLASKFRNMGPARRARIVAQAWQSRRIHYPYQLRELVDTRDRWDLGSLSGLLRVNQEVSRQLLRSLGYVQDAGSAWVLGTSKKARLRRQKWLKDERHDAMSAYFEVNPRGTPPEDLG